MLNCNNCGAEVSDYSSQLCPVDWCPNVFCMPCGVPGRLCKDHEEIRLRALKARDEMRAQHAAAKEAFKKRSKQ
jgi:hypothetical protein